MKRLVSVLLLLALLAATTSMAFAGVDWDGDPLLSVGGTKMHVDFSIADGVFVRAGGQIALTATAPGIRLLGRGPNYITTDVVSGGAPGHLLLTTQLSGAEVPQTFVVRVRIANKGVEWTFLTHNGATVDFTIPQ